MTPAGYFDGLPLGQAGALLVDPPWFFTTYSDKGRKKSADRHYPCMAVEEIKSLPVATLCAADCALHLWTTQAFAQIAMGVMNAWGFTFSCMGVWAKQSKTGSKWQFGTGHVLRSAAEFYLVGKRGHPRRISRSVRNLIVAPVREHSRKPDEIYDQIEALWPGPYVELFARHQREGWFSWGNELR
jgi:N6-adenosine-specific RNA methylase IME4